LDERLPLFAREWISFYQAWLKRLARRQQRSVLWRLTGRRFVQTGVEMFFASALVLFALPIYRWLRHHLGEDWLFPNGLPILFWCVYGVVLLAPLVAVWRNVEALAMILAESATRGASRHSALRPLLETALKTVALALLVIWLLAILPFGWSLVWVSVVVLAVLGLLALAFWKRLVRWHSRLEIELQTQFKMALGSGSAANLAQALEDQQEHWPLQAEEFVLPDLATCAGQSIGSLALRQRFGCSIAAIDRQGFMIPNPSAEVALFPRDKLLLLGSADQIDRATRELGILHPDIPALDIEEQSLDVVTVPPDSPKADKTLMELDLLRQVGVQIAGIKRGPQRTLTPRGADRIQTGDVLLVLGTPRQIQEFREWLNPPR
jgi:CPA2 family monovalent cation:H+ antiporter-2